MVFIYLSKTAFSICWSFCQYYMVCLSAGVKPIITHYSSVMAGKSRFSASDRFEYLQGLVTEFQDTDSEGMSVFAYALHLYIFVL